MYYSVCAITIYPMITLYKQTNDNLEVLFILNEHELIVIIYKMFLGVCGMAGISTLSVNGKEIILVDCANLDIKHKEETIAILQQASRLVAAKPSKSVRIITDITNLSYNTEIFEAFKRYAADNTAYVLGSALVGLNGLQKVMFNAIKTITRRDYHIASSMEDATSYLTQL